MGSRYIKLKAEEIKSLNEIWRNSSSSRARSRAHALLLSDKRTDIKSLSKIFFVHRDTIRDWLLKWEKEGMSSLLDLPRTGRPPIFTTAEKKIIDKAEAVTVQRVKVFTQEIIEEYNKVCSSYTIKRIFKSADLLWKRMRNSLKFQRDEVLFDFFKEELQLLRNQSNKGEIDLYFFDEAGFNLKPNVPYAWQKKGETILLPAIRGNDKNSFTVLGLLNIDRQEFEGNLLYSSSANTEYVIHFLDRFSLKVKEKGRKTVLILDNATIHTANLVKQRAKVWRERGLFLQYIPAYVN